ncbi:MAG: hypothetical protein Q8K30_04525 [Candidatus Gracilibacteria bacterium]|nr:hypothetical protein [Candidatus Gracilibacteria bacterium]
MINKKILAGLLLVSIVTAGIGSTFANDTNTGTTSTGRIIKGEFKKGLGGFGFGKHFGNKGGYYNLTDAEKTALKSMTNDEKKAFYDKKGLENKKIMDENFAKKEKEEAVIDALLAGNKLTDEQNALRNEIIKERNERKIEMQKRKNQMDEIKKIIDKKESGIELTTEEKTKLEELKGEKRKGRHGR